MTIPHERIDKSDVHYTVPKEDYTRLLAVARAAKAFVYTEWTFDVHHCPPAALKEHDKLIRALAAVEDLL